ncbi:hypothetical protein M2G95_02125 [Vibrio vulnificus]|uniref:phosphoribosyltransferase-like protein n=1 Tax=Vibrio vulnificus TaxID=672 RepID=UPI00098689A4|nr:hypothetical protein [Vibrio vulnificus]OOI07476.1 hypothetical protein BIW16_02165 [Vibrio sp. OULL4]EHU5198479.1 hypothetical protein [Vibrio vulnificus]MCU8122656.1 hypothetical protein [Vibrio vulnificus]MCU8300753.1 hypothetical protein [Vibrio vulnificus]MDK2638099.1 hypothetical protein [Vibrio vulnificus]
MLSQVPSTQQWLSQFMPEHRKTASLLLDSLQVISSEEMRNDLKVMIEGLAEEANEKAVLLPIREVEDDESIYDLEDQTSPPTLQASQESLGSEAFISNLYTELSRDKPLQFLQERVEGRAYSPSIAFMRENKFKHLFLVDDLIGSGDRVVAYLNALFKHRTINSWVSYGYLKVHIVSYMATSKGEAVVSKAVNRRKNVDLNIMYSAPSISDLPASQSILELCKAYAKKGTRYPVGYKDSAVRVVFTHSAPNNLPSILHQNVHKKYRAQNVPLMKAKQWLALFPRRAIPNQFKQDVDALKVRTSIRYDLLNLLTLISEDISSRQTLAVFMNKPAAYVQTLIELGEKLQFIVKDGVTITITGRGRDELESRAVCTYHVEKKVNFYYPA